jgi:hypothetical protein
LLDLGGAFWWLDYGTFRCGNTFMAFGLFEQFACFNLNNLITFNLFEKNLFQQAYMGVVAGRGPQYIGRQPKTARPMLLSDDNKDLSYGNLVSTQNRKSPI